MKTEHLSHHHNMSKLRLILVTKAIALFFMKSFLSIQSSFSFMDNNVQFGNTIHFCEQNVYKLRSAIRTCKTMSLDTTILEVTLERCRIKNDLEITEA